jgi:hypothetical protein
MPGKHTNSNRNLVIKRIVSLISNDGKYRKLKFGLYLKNN